MPHKRTKQTLLEHNLAPKKRFGQNFLTSTDTAEAIVDCAPLCENDIIIEVGVGLGALTKPIARKVKQVIGIEIDSGIIRFHTGNKTLATNVKLIHGDILKLDFSDLAIQSGSRLKIMANLPYSISNPFIFKLIENREYVEWVIVMLQKEVAERLMANPSTKNYGIPTVLLASCAQVHKLKLVKPHEFHPQPKVDSLVLRLDFCKASNQFQGLPPYNYTLFQKIVRSAFAKRRKTLLNNLATANIFAAPQEKSRNRELSASAIHSAGLALEERAENLTLHQFVELTVEVQRKLSADDD